MRMTRPRAVPAEPVQARSRKTMNRILAAAESLLAQSSIDRVGVAEITAKAGVAAGSFYTRFKDKDDLLAHLVQRYVDDMHARSTVLEPRLLAESRLEKRLELVIEAITNLFATRRGIVRSVLMKIRHDPNYENPELMQEFLGFYDRAGKLLVGDGSEVTAGDPQAAGRFCMQLIASFSRDAILFEEFPVQLTTPSKDPAFKLALRLACLGVLRGA